jgi:hypothetical protein
MHGIFPYPNTTPVSSGSSSTPKKKSSKSAIGDHSKQQTPHPQHPQHPPFSAMMSGPSTSPVCAVVMSLAAAAAAASSAERNDPAPEENCNPVDALPSTSHETSHSDPTGVYGRENGAVSLMMAAAAAVASAASAAPAAESEEEESSQPNVSTGGESTNGAGSNLSLIKIPTPTLSMFNLSPGGGMNAGERKNIFSAERLRQMGFINMEAFCEICCKKFCNKYFLRTHKFKKHGICSMPEHPDKQMEKHPPGTAGGNETGATEQHTPLNLIRSSTSMSKNSARSGASHEYRPAPTASAPESLDCNICQRSLQRVYLLSMHRTYFHGGSNDKMMTSESRDDASGQSALKCATTAAYMLGCYR